MKQFFVCLLTTFSLGIICAQPGNVLEKIIHQHKNTFGAWAQDPGKFEVQVIYTQIDRDVQNKPTFKSHFYHVDDKRYFYPASTVKMPTAFMALEKINRLKIRGLNKETPMKTGATRPPQTPALADSTSINLLPSISQYIKKIFLVSNNDANNRLYEFLGQAYLNEGLRTKGYRNSRIIHRLSVSGFDAEGNRHTNPVSFYQDDSLLYFQGEVYSKFEADLDLRGEQKGIAYLDDHNNRVEGAFDFSGKNFVSLKNLHDILQAVIFPDAVAPERRFDLSEEDYRLLYQCLSEFPSESAYPAYKNSGDNDCKFWMFGDSAQISIPPNIRIFNKIGGAYGFLIDVAYIVDFERGVEFMLAGVIHVNANQIYNDGVYEYNQIALPFFRELGQAVYTYELQRRRKHKADLSRYKVLYD